MFTNEATEVARHMGWVKSVIFSEVINLLLIHPLNYFGTANLLLFLEYVYIHLGETRRSSLAFKMCSPYN